MTEQTKPQKKDTLKWIKEKFKSDHPLSREEENILFSLAQKGNISAKEKLLRSNMKFVIKVAANYSNNTLSQEELINEGAIGLWHAIQYYDMSRGVRFITYAVWWIKAHITRAISEKGSLIRLPLNQQFLLKKARKDRSQGKEMEDSMQILDAMEKHTTSLDQPIFQGSSYSMEEFIKDERSESVDQGTRDMLKSKFLQKVLNKIPPKERKVLKDLCGLDQDYCRSVREESRILKLSRERIRQLRDQALRRIRNLDYDGHISAELYS
ncbi:MAG: sigma-70 family RNA polymerase sigma factor [Fibrobacter sp.]|nr:sigma-70 family RNA polymerase sigma factor [Fibrobacter sp.]